MIAPDATALMLVMEAQLDPLAVLRVCQKRLIEAPDMAAVKFDEFSASEQVREIAAVLKAVADSLKAHSLSGAKRQRARQRMIAKAQAHPDTVTTVELADSLGSPAWQALDTPDVPEERK